MNYFAREDVPSDDFRSLMDTYEPGQVMLISGPAMEQV